MHQGHQQVVVTAADCLLCCSRQLFVYGGPVSSLRAHVFAGHFETAGAAHFIRSQDSKTWHLLDQQHQTTTLKQSHMSCDPPWLGGQSPDKPPLLGVFNTTLKVPTWSNIRIMGRLPKPTAEESLCGPLSPVLHHASASLATWLEVSTVSRDLQACESSVSIESNKNLDIYYHESTQYIESWSQTIFEWHQRSHGKNPFF